uniref:Serpin domain-containing protein n=1 Tax=Anopheles farauti TaxID=69004 RepID=A0A182Q4S9_9DIPT
MTLFRALSLALCVLLASSDGVNGQWNRYYSTRPPVTTRLVPLLGSRIVSRQNFQTDDLSQQSIVWPSDNSFATTKRPVTTFASSWSNGGSSITSAARRPSATPSRGNLSPTRNQAALATNAIAENTLRPENDPKIAQAANDFMLRVSRTLVQGPSKSELFSPLSILSVANLLFLGSQGVTHEEFNRVLTPPGMRWQKMHQRFGMVLKNLLSPTPIDERRDQWRRQTCPSQDEDYDDETSTGNAKSQVIRVANGIFYQKNLPLKQQFGKLAVGLYNANLQPIDPRNTGASTAMINEWISKATAGKIRNMLDGALSPATSVVVANALYFKAKWKTQFEPLVTRDASFFPDGYDGPSFRVKMMSTSGCLPYYKAPEAIIVGLPYRDDSATMYLIQPEGSSTAAIRRLQGTLTSKMLETWIGQMKLQSTSVRLPKMHLTNSIDLLQTFQKLGFNSILSPAKSNLTGMVADTAGTPKPYVNQILHKLDLTIDEEGTEGAAATSALIDRIGSQRSFNGNAPFIIYLRHDATGLPLFYGPILDPRN